MQFDAIGGAEVTNKAAKLTLLDRSERSPNIYPTVLVSFLPLLIMTRAPYTAVV
jgi:hypothetical protein